MKKFIPLILLAGSIVLGSCQHKEKSAEKAPAPIIEKPQLKLESDIMTPEVLWSFGRITEVEISPDQSTLLFGITYYSKEQNKGNRELYTIGVDGMNMKRVTETPFSEYSALWRPDGKKIGFLSAESGSMQLWEMNPDGSGRKKISDVEVDGITWFSYSPDGKKVLYTNEVATDKTVKDIYPDLPLSSGRIMNDLMYRHWDTWVDTYSHIFIAGHDGEKLSDQIGRASCRERV